MNRRSLLRALGAATIATGAGCLEGPGGDSPTATPTPVNLSGQKLDDQGGMVIGVHGGPNGQIFYAENTPTGHDNPAWFHTLVFGLFPYYFDHRQRGWTAEAVYVTDYSTVDYELTESRDGPVISAPTDPERFGPARAQTYVLESDVRGGMGPALLPFSNERDAQSFVDTHGGRTVAFDDVTQQLLDEYTRGHEMEG